MQESTAGALTLFYPAAEGRRWASTVEQLRGDYRVLTGRNWVGAVRLPGRLRFRRSYNKLTMAILPCRRHASGCRLYQLCGPLLEQVQVR